MPGGMPRNDPQLTGFFSGASVRDECDAGVGLWNDAPSTFPLGETVVAFRARDASGNPASCTATVTVLDTLPPNLIVHVSPNLLWPPNHKLTPVHASVAAVDVCDLSIALQLADLTSSEPESGLGDGDQTPDVVNAQIGGDDRDFSLRAERSGRGIGRTYRICYRAVDDSGNGVNSCAAVVVPHDQGHQPEDVQAPAPKHRRSQGLQDRD